MTLFHMNADSWLSDFDDQLRKNYSISFKKYIRTVVINVSIIVLLILIYSFFVVYSSNVIT